MKQYIPQALKLISFLTLLVGLSTTQLVADTNDENWISMGGLPGTDFKVSGDIVAHGTDIYISGAFNTAGSASVEGIAHWDGNTWNALGSGIPSPLISVFALAVDSSGNLYAGGTFTSAGGISANHIAKWDGNNWSALGSGLSGCAGVNCTPTVSELAIDSNDNLYLSGNFSSAGGIAADHIAKWDGNNWSALGSGVSSSSVTSLVIDGNDHLYAGGDFTSAGGISANYIAKWDGNNWSSLGSGLDDHIYTLAVDSNDNIYAGGTFTSAGGVAANHIAKWDGNDWSALGSGTDEAVFALTIDSADTVYAGGDFELAGGIAVSAVAKWDGNNWVAMGAGVKGTYVPGSSCPPCVFGLATDINDNVYVTGQFTQAGGKTANNIAKWNGFGWLNLTDSPMVAPNSAVKAAIHDSTGNLYIGGDFQSVDGVSGTAYIAMWDGTTWHALDGGMSNSVHALAFDGSGNLYAAGAFSKAGGVTTGKIAKWDGSSWSALGDATTTTGEVYTLIFDGNGNLFAGGNYFFSSSSIPITSGVAKWDGSNWSTLGSGMSLASQEYVESMAIDADDNLYVGGDFEICCSGKGHIRRWNGSQWDTPGGGVSDKVTSLIIDNITGNLLVSTDGSGLLEWDGSYNSQSAPGGEYMAYDPWGNLYMVMNNGVRRRDSDNAWHDTLGSGTNAHPATISFDNNGDLFIGGPFTTVGGQVSAYLAKWEWPGDVDTDGMPDTWENIYGLNPLVDDAADDLDADGVSNYQEYLDGTDPSEYEGPARASDLNNDLTSDLLWYNNSNGTSRNWLMLNNDQDSVVYNNLFANLNFSPLATGDMDADGDADIFWRNTTTGQNVVWLMQDGIRDSVIYMNSFSASGFLFSALADFDGDGDSDIFWHKASTGQTRIWSINTGNLDIQIYTQAANTTLSVKSVGDYNNDGINDIVWQKADGSTQIWLMDNTANPGTIEYLPIMNTAFSIKGSGDFDLDGDDDLLIRNDITGQNTIWVMEAGSRSSQAYINAFDPAKGYTVDAIGDYDGDGDEDIFWRNASTGQNIIWVMKDNDLSYKHYPQCSANKLDNNSLTMMTPVT